MKEICFKSSLLYEFCYLLRWHTVRQRDRNFSLGNFCHCLISGYGRAMSRATEFSRSSLSRKLASNKYLKGLSVAKIPPRTSFPLDKHIDVKTRLCLGAMRSSLLGSNSKMLHLVQRFSAVREQRYFHSTPGPYYRWPLTSDRRRRVADGGWCDCRHWIPGWWQVSSNKCGLPVAINVSFGRTPVCK